MSINKSAKQKWVIEERIVISFSAQHHETHTWDDHQTCGGDEAAIQKTHRIANFLDSKGSERKEKKTHPQEKEEQENRTATSLDYSLWYLGISLSPIKWVPSQIVSEKKNLFDVTRIGSTSPRVNNPCRESSQWYWMALLLFRTACSSFLWLHMRASSHSNRETNEWISNNIESNVKRVR